MVSRKLVWVWLFSLVLAWLAAVYLPFPIQQFLYAISLFLKDGILFIFPWLVFALLFKASVGLAYQATRVVLVVAIGVLISSFAAVFLSYFLSFYLPIMDLMHVSPMRKTGLQPSWVLGYQPWIHAKTMLWAGIIAGVGAAIMNLERALRLADRLNQYTNKVLQGMVYLMPMILFGFILKEYAEANWLAVIKQGGKIIIVVALIQISYLILIYVGLSLIRKKGFFSQIKSLLPAAYLGFITLSSAMAMPLTLLGITPYARYRELVRAVIAATVQMHWVGDCLAIPLLALAVMHSFGIPAPDLMVYASFALSLVLILFSATAIPGGVIWVILPVLHEGLGFNMAMLSLTTLLYVLCEPLITVTNIMGNGAFAGFIDRIAKLLRVAKE